MIKRRCKVNQQMGPNINHQWVNSFHGGILNMLCNKLYKVNQQMGPHIDHKSIMHSIVKEWRCNEFLHLMTLCRISKFHLDYEIYYTKVVLLTTWNYQHNHQHCTPNLTTNNSDYTFTMDVSIHMYNAYTKWYLL